MVGKRKWVSKDTDTGVAEGKAEVRRGWQASRAGVGWRGTCVFAPPQWAGERLPGSDGGESCRCRQCSLVSDAPSFPAHTPVLLLTKPHLTEGSELRV